MYLRTLHLVNFMGYRDTVFNFMEDGKTKPINLIFAPNGCGKTSLLAAIELVYSAKMMYGRDSTTLMRKHVFNTDYDSTYEGVKETVSGYVRNEMLVEANLVDDVGIEYRVILNNQGVVECNLPSSDLCKRVDADNPMNLNKFQMPMGPSADKFLEIAKVVYNYDCGFDIGKSTMGVFSDDNRSGQFWTDFILVKYGVRVHFRSFSGGEKKLATMLAQILDYRTLEFAKCVIIDGFEKEIYWKRQIRAVDKLLEVISGKQLFIVTHSQTLIEHVEKTYGEECLYDIEKYKMDDVSESYNN